MKILLYQLDGSVPNVALMRIAFYHKLCGDEVELRHTQKMLPMLSDKNVDKVYASAIFEKTKPVIQELKNKWPDAVIGGTGSDSYSTLEDVGIQTLEQDYSIYPNEQRSIGFTQRGCRLKCPFCVVPKKEGKVQSVSNISDIWRGGEYPKELLLLDNDFFGQEDWLQRITEMIQGGFKVSINQGINLRILTKPQAAALSSIDYRDSKMQTKRIYAAWDNTKDEIKVKRGIERLIAAGVKPFHFMIYVLTGYPNGDEIEDALYRVRKLIEWGTLPYPMPYIRNKHTVGLQRWVVRRYYNRVPWEDFKQANYDPTKCNYAWEKS